MINSVPLMDFVALNFKIYCEYVYVPIGTSKHQATITYRHVCANVGKTQTYLQQMHMTIRDALKCQLETP